MVNNILTLEQKCFLHHGSFDDRSASEVARVNRTEHIIKLWLPFNHDKPLRMREKEALSDALCVA